MIKITSQMLTYHLYFCILVGQITVAALMAMSLFKALDWFNKVADKIHKK